ncbi:hypothetical protein GCM10020331_057180 [Ectobacillus funiculus]
MHAWRNCWDYRFDRVGQKQSCRNDSPFFYDADAGAVRVSGVDVRELNPQKLRETIAIVPQKNDAIYRNSARKTFAGAKRMQRWRR